MDKSGTTIEFLIPGHQGSEQPDKIFTLEGRLEDYSTPRRHSHACHQFLRIRSGITLLEEAGQQQPLFSSMAAFIPAGLAHRSVVLGNPVTYKSIYMDPALFPAEKNRIIIFEMSDLGRALFDRISVLSPGPGPEQPADPEPVQQQCLSLWLLLTREEIRNLASITRIPVPENPDNLRITRFIETAYHQKLRLEEIAAQVHYSPRHMARRFKADLGLTVFEYLRLYRVFRSAILLSDSGPGEDTVTRIALSCGYESLSCFYKDFKSLFSLTPRQFRQAVGKNRSSALKDPV